MGANTTPIKLTTLTTNHATFIAVLFQKKVSVVFVK